MRRLVLKMSMSLDGFVCGPNGELDWIFRSLDDELTAWQLDALWQAGVHRGLEAREKQSLRHRRRGAHRRATVVRPEKRSSAAGWPRSIWEALADTSGKAKRDSVRATRRWRATARGSSSRST
jgi:hypothetical protein